MEQSTTTPNEKISISALDTLKNVAKKDEYSEIRQEVKNVLSEIRFTLDIMSINNSDEDIYSDDGNDSNMSSVNKK